MDKLKTELKTELKTKTKPRTRVWRARDRDQQRMALRLLGHLELLGVQREQLCMEFNEFTALPGFQPFFRELLAATGGRQTADSTAMIVLLHALHSWHHQHRPTFKLANEQLLRALRDTEIPDFPVEELQLPYAAVKLELPQGALDQVIGSTNEMYVMMLGQRFRVVVPTLVNGEPEVHFINMNLGDVRTIEEAVRAAPHDWLKSVPDDASEDELALAREFEENRIYQDYFESDVFRLAVNFALYVTSPNADMFRDKRELGRIHAKLQGLRKKNKRRALEQQLEREREYVRYLVGANFRLSPEYNAELSNSGRSWALKHRVRVMGHWRQQPWGPRGSLRRRQWIAPHWRGPDYAEMVRLGYVVS